MHPKQVRELRPIFQGSELGSRKKELSSDTCGRLCVFVTPRSASKRSYRFWSLIEVPRSAWQGELTGLDVLFLAALLDQSLGQLPRFRDKATIQPVTYRLKHIEEDVQVEVSPFRGPE